MRWLKWIGLALAVILALGLGGFLAWAYTPLGPAPAAVAALDQTLKFRSSKSNGSSSGQPARSRPRG